MKLKNKYQLIIIIALILLIFVIILFNILSNNNSTYISYKEFNKYLISGDIDSASLDGEKVFFNLKSASGEYYTDNPSTENFKETLLLNDVKLDDSFNSFTVEDALDILFYLVFFVFIGFAIYKITATFGGQKFKVVRKTNTTFNDICGMADIKKDMTKTIDIIKNPQEYEQKGIRAPKGIILEGPPGNGKTLFAKALATEAGLNFIPAKGADFQSAIMSIGPQKIKALFRKARKNKPCILFIDEFDSIGERRSYTGMGIDKENNRIITAMLNEMDGFEEKDGVLVIGATNSYSSLDSALIRPGRFDKKFNIGNPDKNTLKELLEMYTPKIKLSQTINKESLIKCLSGISCSAIETLLNEATLEAVSKNKDEISIEDIIIAGKKTNIININKL
jgi:cell division protease FtsH